jgi:hypothetical protein
MLHVALTATCGRHICTMLDQLMIDGLGQPVSCNQRCSLHRLSLETCSFKVYLMHTCGDIG